MVEAPVSLVTIGLFCWPHSSYLYLLLRHCSLVDSGTAVEVYGLRQLVGMLGNSEGGSEIRMMSRTAGEGNRASC